MPFDVNPCRRNPFDAFALGKDEDGIKAIRRAIADARNLWKDRKGVVIARDGGAWTISEAQLNSLEKEMCDPLRRLQIEQFVYQEHPFTGDEEIARQCRELARPPEAGVPADMIDRISGALLTRLIHFVPDPKRPPIADDLPWPAEPEARAIEFESLDRTLLRE